MKRRNSPISSRISAGGRDQFSALNEKMVRKSIPRSPAARTVRRSASTPRRCPSPRGSPRAAAQRPLPSMMMATCRGTAMSPIRAVRSGSCSDMPVQTSHGENFLLFCCEHPVDFGDCLVGGLLHLLAGALAVVLADLVVLLELLEHIQAVAPHVTHRYAGGFGIFVRNLHQLPAALLIELGNPQAQQLPFAGWSETEIGRSDGLFHGVDHRSVPDLHRYQPRLGHADGGDLVKRHMAAIGLDLDGIEQARRGAAGAQPSQLLLQELDCALHAPLELVEIVCRVGHGDLERLDELRRCCPACGGKCHCYSLTTVKRPFPRSTAAIAPCSRIENTMIGIRFSRASAKAVVSITLRLRAIASWWVSRS